MSDRHSIMQARKGALFDEAYPRGLILRTARDGAGNVPEPASGES